MARRTAIERANRFPTDRYTPHGYLRNPAARATSWAESHGGLLRSTVERPGVGWFYPHGRRPSHGAAIEGAVELDGRRYHTRADFAALDLRSEHHSADLLSYDWDEAGLAGSFAFFLADPDALVGLARVTNRGTAPREVVVELVGHVWPHEEAEPIAPAPSGGVPNATPVALGCPGPARRGQEARSARRPVRALQLPAAGPRPLHILRAEAGEPVFPEPGRAGFRFALRLLPQQAGSALVVLARGPAVRKLRRLTAGAARAALARRLRADAAFWRAAPQLAGAWPDHWRRGWVYDLETTRMLVFPPGGVFQDIWPSWMAHFPRAVLAEGTLDLARLVYADPATARRALLALFRDTGPNVPCVFQGGEPNMVAADGSVCGTSPAWCIPYHNLLQVYRRDPDRAWLAAIYPFLVRYLEWWREHRSDADGWLVYKCTWEAGEDNTPRLDPRREGDAVIERFVRPVELQAATAYSYRVLACFAEELGRTDDARRWLEVGADYARKTQTLWDEAAGRFRDWDKRRQDFIAPVGDTDYWGTDPGRYSPLALIPLLDRDVTPEQRVRLRAEIEHYDAPPWCDWPSWAYVVLEAATAVGWHDFAARMAYRIVDRVWRENDRDPTRTLADERTTSHLADALRPLPGVAREYWPSDLATWNGHDCYGWGATTANLFLRQIVGFREDPDTSRLVFRLCPALPPDLLARGGRFGVRNLRYRGARFDLWYERAPDGAQPAPEGREQSAAPVVDATLEFARSVRLRVEGPGLAHDSGRSARTHRVRLRGLTEYQALLG